MLFLQFIQVYVFKKLNVIKKKKRGNIKGLVDEIIKSILFFLYKNEKIILLNKNKIHHYIIIT